MKSMKVIQENGKLSNSLSQVAQLVLLSCPTHRAELPNSQLCHNFELPNSELWVAQLTEMPKQGSFYSFPVFTVRPKNRPITELAPSSISLRFICVKFSPVDTMSSTRKTSRP